MPTKQEIIDRNQALNCESSKAYQVERARIQTERKSLQELCGGDAQGHVFHAIADLMDRVLGAPRVCLFCYAPEPASKSSTGPAEC